MTTLHPAIQRTQNEIAALADLLAPLNIFVAEAEALLADVSDTLPDVADALQAVAQMSAKVANGPISRPPDLSTLLHTLYRNTNGQSSNVRTAHAEATRRAKDAEAARIAAQEAVEAQKAAQEAADQAEAQRLVSLLAKSGFTVTHD